MSYLLLTLLFHSLTSFVSTTAAAPITPSSPALFVSSDHLVHDTASCLKASYYGTYGGVPEEQDHIYIPTDDCLLTVSALDAFTSGSIVPIDDLMLGDGDRLVWVGRSGVSHIDSQAVLPIEESWSLISSRSRQILSESDSRGGYGTQHVLQKTYELHHVRPIVLVHQTKHSLLVNVPSSFLPIFDTLLPPHLVPVALPSDPLPISVSGWQPVPEKFAKHLANITEHLSFSPELDKILSEGIRLDQIRRDVRWLTGEAPSGIKSRHSFTSGAVKTAQWISSQVKDTGADCTLQHFLPGFAPNVICHYPSTLNSTEHVIFSAHYDSRGSFGSTRAPGGDDDGSGSGHLLSLARAINSQGIVFEKAVTLAFFAGEEQGLLGSHAYADDKPGEPLQLGLPEIIHLPEASYLIGNLSQLYSPELVVGKTAACCSDHQSFVTYGFPATQVFERNGPIVDPMYHNSGDISQREGYDFEQIVSIAKVTLSALLTVAGYKRVRV
ncbi:aminopeptidase [Cryptococcus deuterogattii 99/473]|uniref:Peptide hydrolase n=1 Tax=Cryptococcus deuterogattii Ram5 TaxID=1296110 RepID=A0A0D0UZE7_9TREE|nr:aminopeptidase [Cryptococcus deuterogattii Ram5]KIY55252.1 aminopeptidase [Cryptococcus deuterogattii 99/473]